MLRHLRIENFKAWKDTGDIELAPISVFLGTNSSGKSSIFQFLMMLKQTMQDPITPMVLNTGNEHSIVDVGQPDHMLYRHDTSQPLRFSYDWDVDTPFLYSVEADFPEEVRQTLKKTEDGRAYQTGTDVHFECSLSVGNVYVPATVQRLFYQCFHSYSDSSHELFSVEMQEQTQIQTYSPYKVKVNLKGVPENPLPGYLIQPWKFYGFPNTVLAAYPSVPVLQTMNSVHSALFSNMFYLGPLRDRSSRLYTWKGVNPLDVGIDGRDAISAMLSTRLDFRKFAFDDKSKCEMDEAVAKMLEKMGLIEEFQVRRIAPERQEYAVQVKIKGSHVWADLPDVGCGVSQVLPVLVELFHAPPGSIILIEQPELHLHPSAQAALADVMIDAVQAKENGKPRNIQLLIETHSEYFLRRLQRRVAEEAIPESMIRGYFADTATDPFQLRKLEIDAYGNILNWPEDFFGDVAGDILRQAKEAFRRKKDEYKQNAEHH